MTLEELGARITVLEDIEAIKKLQIRIAYLTDAGKIREAMDYLTEDAVADYGDFGIHEGRAAVTKFYTETLPASLSPFMFHMLHNPVIEVQGGKATGEWYVETAVIHSPTNRAMWMTAKYENKYVKVGGEWKLKTWVSRIHYFTPYDEGWAKTKMYG